MVDVDLDTALNTHDHHIISDIKFRLERWGTISPAQVALVKKIHNQLEERANENWLPVPVENGRQTIVGKVVHHKWNTMCVAYNTFVSQLKALIIIETPEGKWKTWGTIPQSIIDELPDPGLGEWEDVGQLLRGKTIQFDAKLKVSNDDPAMSFFSRPSKGKIVEEK